MRLISSLLHLGNQCFGLCLQENFLYQKLVILNKSTQLHPQPKRISLSKAKGKIFYIPTTKRKQTPWPESANEIYRPSPFLAKLVPTFEDRGFHVVSALDPYGRISFHILSHIWATGGLLRPLIRP
jgi:hypothetical protein